MSLLDVPDSEGIHTVDTHLLGMPGVMSAYLVEGERTALVDTGAAPAVDHVLAALDERGIAPADLDYVLPTHVHLDHAGAAGTLARECPNASVLVHERGREYLVDADRRDALVDSARRALGEMADFYGEPELVPADRCETLADGDEVDLGDRTLRAVDAPGHAPHQFAFYDERDGVLLAADAAGSSIAGDLYPTTPPPNFDLEQSVETIDRLLDLDPSVVCYGHFGCRTDATEALEAARDQLPEWVDAVRDAADEHDDRADVVAALSSDWPMPTLQRDVAGVLRYLENQ